MDFKEVIEKRYSCRKFESKPVEDDKLTKILEAANLAPTAKNAQPVKIWVFKSNDSLEKIKTVTRFHFNAPVILAVGGTKDGAFVRPDGRNYEDVDACIVATHLMLAVHDLGLGSTWVGFFDADKLKELFPEMKDFDLVALFPIGYPANDSQPSERHSIRKNLDEIVKYL